MDLAKINQDPSFLNASEGDPNSLKRKTPPVSPVVTLKHPRSEDPPVIFTTSADQSSYPPQIFEHNHANDNGGSRIKSLEQEKERMLQTSVQNTVLFGSMDGFDRDRLVIDQTETLKEWHQKLLKTHVCLLRAPPSSGKTYRGHQLKKYVETLGRGGVFYTCEKGKTPPLPSTYENKDTPYLVIIDEVQEVYELGSDNPFWSAMRSLMSAEDDYPVYYILLAAYSLTTGQPTYQTKPPILFQLSHCFYLSDLRFTRVEFDSVFDLYRAQPEARNAWINRDNQELIWKLTNGHPAHVKFALKAVYSRFSQLQSAERDDRHMAGFLHSGAFHSQLISGLRGLSQLHGLTHDMKKILYELLQNEVLPENTVPLGLAKLGVVCPEWSTRKRGMGYQLTSPVIRAVVLHVIQDPMGETQ